MIDAEFSRNSADSNNSDDEGRFILVDGFNVLHAVLLGKERETGWWGRESRERLLRRISVWQSGPDEIWVAFDGNRPAWAVWAEPVAIPVTSGSKRSIVHSVFVESADDWIVRRARRARHPDRTIVVSGDRKVTGRARSAGCEIWTPWALMSHCPTIDDSFSERCSL
jgi:predicted RNA-binding protein with PIN domain